MISSQGAVLPSANITQYLSAIFNLGPSELPTFHCPPINTTRYGFLQSKAATKPAIRYFFALNLQQNLDILPRLIGSITMAIWFLGPENCALSIIEGNSVDGTADILKALSSALVNMGTLYYFNSTSLDASKADRVSRLADLRNLALAPLLKLHTAGRVAKDVTAIFLNDVAACSEDILELLYQKQVIGADMTCAMDWTYGVHGAVFYDVWISRTIDGDSFFNHPADGSLELAKHLFWNSEETRRRFFSTRPFQVFACWNGAVAFTAEPIIRDIVHFRGRNKEAGECDDGEPNLFCKDLWFHGYGKIAVIPSVNLEYSVEKGRMIKQEKGYVTDAVSTQDASADRIDWRLNPPEKVKCFDEWTSISWRPWNETLP